MFPFDENVIEALHLFQKQNADYVQLVKFDIVLLDFIKERRLSFIIRCKLNLHIYRQF
jgi:hypothetical protein